MKIYNSELSWTKGESGYVQGIKGRQNYRHIENGSYYNGYGGAKMNVPMELEIIGIDKNGKKHYVDVRHYLIEALGRKKMNDTLYSDLQKCIPNEIEIDDETKLLSASTIEAIRQNYEQLKGKKSKID